MHLDLTAEQHSLRKQLRTYYRDLFTPDLRAALNAEWDDMGGSVVPPGRRANGRRRLARDRLAEGIRRPGPRPARTADLLGRDVPRPRAAPDHRRQHHRPDADALRHRRTEARDAARHPARRAALRHRLHRARRRHRPRVAHHARRSRRRRLGHQRPEDLHDPRPRRRLHLARGAHRHRSAEAQGHHDHPGADLVARLLGDADPHARRRAHQRDLLRRRARARREHDRPGERRLVADHLAAQPRAHHARDARRRRSRARRSVGLGDEDGRRPVEVA